MGIEKTKKGKLLYHLTKLDNLDSILKGGLISRKSVKDKKINFSDVADTEIISKREKLGLHEYIPFHFHPYSAFDKAVKSNYDEEFIYICIKRDLARHNKFVILPKHPLTLQDCKLYDYDEGFELIEWDVMHKIGTTDDHSKHVKMAECLTKLNISAKYFQCIYVKNKDSKLLVEKKLKENGINNKPPYVDVQVWFE